MLKVQSRVHTKQLFGRSGIFASVVAFEIMNKKKTRKKRNLSLIKHWKFEWFISFKFRTTKKYNLAHAESSKITLLYGIEDVLYSYESYPLEYQR